MLNNKVFLYNLIALAVLSIMSIAGGMQLVGIGLAALILAAGNFLIGLVLLAAGNSKSGLTCILSTGLLLLVGFSVCSGATVFMH